MDNTQEIQPEAVAQTESAEQSDLDIAKQQAQQEVDAFLSSTEFDDTTITLRHLGGGGEVYFT